VPEFIESIFKRVDRGCSNNNFRQTIPYICNSIAKRVFSEVIMAAMTLDSDNIRLTQIFAVVLKIYVNFPDFTPAPLYYVFVIKFNCFVYYSSAD